MKAYQQTESSWLKRDDLQGKTVKLTITDQCEKTFADDDGEEEVKVMISFSETDKALVLNPTNCKALKDVYGSDSENWRGVQVELFTEPSSFGDGRGWLKVRVVAEAVDADDVPF